MRPMHGLLVLAIVAALWGAPSSASAAVNELSSPQVTPGSGSVTTVFAFRVRYDGGFPAASVRESLERLAAGKALVLQRDSREVLMANPFSAVPTPFAVRANDTLYYGNCIWDALGIPAMLRADARIDSSCGCCGEAMRLTVRAGQLEHLDAVVHFAVPAHRWWQDIVYD